jgi:hypothetical protein
MAATYKPDLGSHCKNCKADLDDGDIYEKLKSIFYFLYDDDEIRRQARCHGWSKDNGLRFSKEHIVYSNDKMFTVCPECSCKYPLKNNL